MNKSEKYELVFLKFTFLVIALSVVYVATSHLNEGMRHGVSMSIFFDVGFFTIALIVQYIKLYALEKGYFRKSSVYFTDRVLVLVLTFFAIIYIGIGIWAYIVIIFQVLVTSLCRGSKGGLIIVALAYPLNLAMLLSLRLIPGGDSGIYGLATLDVLIELTFLYVLLMIFVIICGSIYKESLQSESENSRLLDELGEKYDQLAVAQKEIKYQYEKLKDANVALEDTNKKLTYSIAEFYTLQQISQAIGSIFDIKELLKYVNDIIIGVMGVNNSTIILFDDKIKRLKIHTSSIENSHELTLIEDNINCELLCNVIENNKPIIENYVSQDKYSFIKGREVGSFICIPLSSKSHKYGVVLNERKHYNAFDNENLRLLEVIGRQVGIALENAGLYQQMQEMATTDGLTGIYNRLYFQERLEKEIENAQKDGYVVTLAILDIDHFKKFNDTYGHLFGDKVLKSMVELMKGSLRSSDFLARFGGEEFVIMFPRTDIGDAYKKVEELMEKIAGNTVADSLVEASVTASFGLSCYPDISTTENGLIRDADNALYQAKAAGRNCAILAVKKPDA